MKVALDERIALITGGTRGVGGAAARRFAAEGASVALLGRSVDPGAELGPGVIGIRGDVTSTEDVERAVEEVIDRFGGLDVLVNGAATLGPLAPLGDEEVKEWLETVQTNLIGTYVACRAVLPPMLRGGYGRIVNFASRAVSSDPPAQSAYNASKAAVVSLTRTLASEVESRGIRVNVVCPGNVATALSDDFLTRDTAGLDPVLQENQRAFRKLRDDGMIWRPEEVLDTVVFLASTASDHVSGQFIQLRLRGDDAAPDPEPAPGEA
jgi:NAD(P)-dependent dehydrogenase (short-subunit alcohol dehydrogenase family)